MTLGCDSASEARPARSRRRQEITPGLTRLRATSRREGSNDASHPERNRQSPPGQVEGPVVRRGRPASLKSGFATNSEARDYLKERVDEIERLRSGDPHALRRREAITLDKLADEYLAQHVCEANTLVTLTRRIKRARDAFGETRVDRLAVSELEPGERRSRLARRTRTSSHFGSCCTTQSPSGWWTRTSRPRSPTPDPSGARSDLRIARRSGSCRSRDGSGVSRHPDLRRAHGAATRGVDRT